MGAAYFYHLTRHPLEATLPVLLDKSRAAGWRVAVRARARQRLEWLDQQLWLGPETGFPAHGIEGGPHDARQPVLLTLSQSLPNRPECLMTIDGAPVSAQEVTALQRVCILFDGTRPEAVEQARAQWKTLTAEGCAAQYWSEESGRWEKKAERAAG